MDKSEISLNFHQVQDIAKAIYLDISDYIESNSDEYVLFLELNNLDK